MRIYAHVHIIYIYSACLSADVHMDRWINIHTHTFIYNYIIIHFNVKLWSIPRIWITITLPCRDTKVSQRGRRPRNLIFDKLSPPWPAATKERNVSHKKQKGFKPCWNVLYTVRNLHNPKNSMVLVLNTWKIGFGSVAHVITATAESFRSRDTNSWCLPGRGTLLATTPRRQTVHIQSIYGLLPGADSWVLERAK
jgi:hypothetical protein